MAMETTVMVIWEVVVVGSGDTLEEKLRMAWNNIQIAEE